MAKQTFTTGQVLTAAQITSLQQTAMLGGSATAKTASYVLVAADAGTTVAMSAAGATTITVNTGLFAEGDIVFIQNRGAGACTVTAGTATVATAGSLILPQNDAGILYFTATDAAIFYDFIQSGAVSPLTTKGDVYTFSTSDARLGVGANNTVLTADSTQATGLKWATATATPTFVGAQIYDSNATTSISNNTATAITFNSEVLDTNTFHSTSSNTSRMTIPSGYAGKYMVVGSCIIQNNATGTRRLDIYKNGASFARSQNFGNSSEQGFVNINTIMDLAVADYVELYVFQNSGGALSIYGGTAPQQGWFNITYLGA
jgi:hypothetical protein